MRIHPSLLIFFVWIPLTWTASDLFLPRMKKFTSRMASQFLDPRFASTRKKIVLIHNFYRSRVNPAASNMLEMKWHKGAQAQAQKWASECQYLIHDKPQSRWVKNYGSCGQNIYVSSNIKDWLKVTKDWYDERDDFIYGGNSNELKKIGHYTQMVWYSSYRVGCGFAICSNGGKRFYNYVCNYCPIGNDQSSLSKPYKQGKSCGECPGKCKYSKLCTNYCRYTNLWSNCEELKTTHYTWLCNDRKSEAFQNCKASCSCKNAII